MMGENEERRQARRQKRGLHRVDKILQAAGEIFAEVGYDSATTNLIAARAGISPGSLYQFFPNKEAITQAYAAFVVEQLQTVYAGLHTPEILALHFGEFLDAFIDRLVAVNKEYPGYLALELGSTISAPLALTLNDLRQGVFASLDGLFAAKWPQISLEQRRLSLLISYRIFLALLPLGLFDKGASPPETIVREMKTVFYRYWEPLVGE